MSWFKRKTKGITTTTEEKKDTPKDLYHKPLGVSFFSSVVVVIPFVFLLNQDIKLYDFNPLTVLRICLLFKISDYNYPDNRKLCYELLMHFDFIIYEILDTQHLRHLLKLSRFYLEATAESPITKLTLFLILW